MLMIMFKIRIESNNMMGWASVMNLIWRYININYSQSFFIMLVLVSRGYGDHVSLRALKRIIIHVSHIMYFLRKKKSVVQMSSYQFCKVKLTISNFNKLSCLCSWLNYNNLNSFVTTSGALIGIIITSNVPMKFITKVHRAYEILRGKYDI